jgi:hypothetical protein
MDSILNKMYTVIMKDEGEKHRDEPVWDALYAHIEVSPWNTWTTILN